MRISDPGSSLLRLARLHFERRRAPDHVAATYAIPEIICRPIDEGHRHYFMYDSLFGAQEGLRNFKKRLGFQPYRVRYSMS